MKILWAEAQIWAGWGGGICPLRPRTIFFGGPKRRMRLSISRKSQKKDGFLAVERVLCWPWLTGNGIVSGVMSSSASIAVMVCGIGYSLTIVAGGQ